MSASIYKFIHAASAHAARSLKNAAVVGLLAAGLFAGVASTAATTPSALLPTPPEPEAIPRRWQLEIEPGPLRLTTVTVGGTQRAFYYLTYRVINNSGEDLLFAPSFELTTEYGNRRSGTDVPTEVTRTLMEQAQNKYIEDQISIIGQLLQGKENAKDGIVIWPANDLDVDNLTIYAAGFSGETTSVSMPSSKEKVVLRKTFQMTYGVSGDMTQMIGKEVTRSESPRWVMR